MILVITKVEDATFSNSGKPYKKVTGMDDKGKEKLVSVTTYFKEQYPLLREGSKLEFKMVKQGNYWNVAGITPVGDSHTSEPPTPEPPPEHATSGVKEPAKTNIQPNNEMSKEEWAERERTTRKSIERQKSLDTATQWTVAVLSNGKKDLKGTDIIKVAQVFEYYLEHGKLPDKMVEEAKKLGAEVVE